MKLKFNESKHEYKLGNKILPSVTDVISHFFEPLISRGKLSDEKLTYQIVESQDKIINFEFTGIEKIDFKSEYQTKKDIARAEIIKLIKKEKLKEFSTKEITEKLPHYVKGNAKSNGLNALEEEGVISKEGRGQWKVNSKTK